MNEPNPSDDLFPKEELRPGFNEGPEELYDIGHDAYRGLIKLGEFASEGLGFTTGDFVDVAPGHCYVEMYSETARYTITIHPKPNRSKGEVHDHISLTRIGLDESEESEPLELYRTNYYELAGVWVKPIALILMKEEGIKMSSGSDESGKRIRVGVTLREFLKRWRIHWDKHDNF
jgi:hypothetical protein